MHVGSPIHARVPTWKGELTKDRVDEGSGSGASAPRPAELVLPMSLLLLLLLRITVGAQERFVVAAVRAAATVFLGLARGGWLTPLAVAAFPPSVHLAGSSS